MTTLHLAVVEQKFFIDHIGELLGIIPIPHSSESSICSNIRHVTELGTISGEDQTDPAVHLIVCSVDRSLYLLSENAGTSLEVIVTFGARCTISVEQRNGNSELLGATTAILLPFCVIGGQMAVPMHPIGKTTEWA